jgi:hypothetical protein
MSAYPGRCFCASRRGLLQAVAGLALLPRGALAGLAPRPPLPLQVAGITLPRTMLAVRAASFSAEQPDFLFNHCMRTYLFGALILQRQHLAYHAETAFVAAALHDLGLLPQFASARASFEIDGANRAEKFARDAGVGRIQADKIWHAVEMHDGKYALTERQGPEAMLVASGAATDVDGPDETLPDSKQIEEVIAAFPRLGFKLQFTSLLVDHCRRKPTSQRATWLEGLCRDTVPAAWSDTTQKEIAAAPFTE